MVCFRTQASDELFLVFVAFIAAIWENVFCHEGPARFGGALAPEFFFDGVAVIAVLRRMSASLRALDQLREAVEREGAAVHGSGNEGQQVRVLYAFAFPDGTGALQDLVDVRG